MSISQYNAPNPQSPSLTTPPTIPFNPQGDDVFSAPHMPTHCLRRIFDEVSRFQEGVSQFALVSRSVYWQAIHGVTPQQTQSIVDQFSDESGQLLPENHSKIYPALRKFEDPKLAFRLEITECFMARIERLLLSPGLNSTDFHSIMGRDIIFARTQPKNCNEDSAKAIHSYHYALHIGKALGFKLFVRLKGFPTQSPETKNLLKLALINLSQSLIDYLKKVFELQKAAVEKMITCQALQTTELDLKNCNIFAVPPHIEQLTHLIKLDLSENSLDTIPAEIGRLSNLKELKLNKNRLTSLPAEIGKLSALEYLDYSDNNYSETYRTEDLAAILPPSIANCRNLKTLILSPINAIGYQFIRKRGYSNLLKFPLELSMADRLEILFPDYQDHLGMVERLVALLDSECPNRQNLKKIEAFYNILTALRTKTIKCKIDLMKKGEPLKDNLYWA